MEKSSLLPIPPYTPTMRPARDRFGSRNTVSSVLSADDIELKPLTQGLPLAGLDESDSEDELSEANELLTFSSAVRVVLPSEIGKGELPAVFTSSIHYYAARRAVAICERIVVTSAQAFYIQTNHVH